MSSRIIILILLVVSHLLYVSQAFDLDLLRVITSHPMRGSLGIMAILIMQMMELAKDHPANKRQDFMPGIL